MGNMKRLQIGCGKDIKEGFVNLDIKKFKGVDIVHDLKKFPYPFKDNEFEVVLASNIIEHFDEQEIEKILTELYRITSRNGKIIISVPYYNSHQAYHSYDHKSYFSYTSFDHYVEGDNENHRTKLRFKIKKKTAASPVFKWIPDIRIKGTTVRVLLSWFIPNLIIYLTFEMKPVKE